MALAHDDLCLRSRQQRLVERWNGGLTVQLRPVGDRADDENDLAS